MVHSSRRDRRNQIVDGLEEVFLKEGFRKVRIEELASRLRCSRQTLYRLAPSKAELFLLVLDRFLERIREEGRDAAYAYSGPDERIEAFLRPGITNTLHASRRFTEDVDGYEPARRLLADHQRERMRQLRALIQDGVDRGVFADIHPQLAAEVMLAAVGRASHPSFLADTGLSMSEAFAECSRFLRSGLARSDKT